MTGPAVTPDPRILANLQRLKDAGAPDDALEAYLNEENAKGSSTPQSRQLHARDVGRRMTSANEADAAQLPSYLSTALGGVAALAKHIPGAEAAQAGARSVVRGQPYTQALSDIRGSEDDNPASGFNGLLGGTIAAAAIPGGPVASGAAYGGAAGLLGADPTSLTDRAKSTAVGAGVGGVLGKILPAAGVYAKSKFMPTLGTQAVTRDAAMSAADNLAYGLAEKQGAAAVTTPAVSKAFAEPDIAPFVELVKGSRKFAGADDGTVLREVYKHMSREQTGLAKKLGEQGYDAATALRAQNIGLAKKQLLDAADTMMPALRDAIKQHAGLAGEEAALEQSSDVATRILNDSRIGGKKLGLKSPEAFARDVKDMTPGEAKAALDGLLGRMKEFRSGSINPLKAFGLAGNLAKGNKLVPYITMLQKQAGIGTGATGLLTNAAQAGAQGLLQ